MTTTDLSRFDSDPDALAWARQKIQHEIDRFADWERKDTEAGEIDRAMQWRKMRNMLVRQFVGTGGCVIAGFDERLPAYVEIRTSSTEVTA